MIILEQVLVNMICMNNLFINLLEAYHKDKFEDYEILCNAVEGFIDENSINGDFNPWSFDYNDVEDEILWMIQEILEEKYNFTKFLLKDKYEEFVKVYSSNQIDAAYLRFDKSTHSFVIDIDILFDELNVVESKHFSETLSQFVKMINDKTTLKLIVE